jgi:hypothetical protein
MPSMRKLLTLWIALAAMLCVAATGAQSFWQSVAQVSVAAGGRGGGTLTWTLQNSGAAATFSGTPSLPFSTTVNIGTPSADRVVIVVISWEAAAGATNGDVSPTGVIVNGVTLTQAVDMYTSAAVRGAAVYYGLVTAGTSVTLSATSIGGSGWWTEGIITVGTLTGSATASVASTIGNGGSPTPPAPWQGGVNSNAAAVTVPSGGMAILGTFSANAPGVADTTWTNATKDLHTNLSSNTAQSVAHANASATVTAAVSNDSSGGSGWAAAVFRP